MVMPTLSRSTACTISLRMCGRAHRAAQAADTFPTDVDAKVAGNVGEPAQDADTVVHDLFGRIWEQRSERIVGHENVIRVVNVFGQRDKVVISDLLGYAAACEEIRHKPSVPLHISPGRVEHVPVGERAFMAWGRVGCF